MKILLAFVFLSTIMTTAAMAQGVSSTEYMQQNVLAPGQTEEQLKAENAQLKRELTRTKIKAAILIFSNAFHRPYNQPVYTNCYRFGTSVQCTSY